jgi:hypothetical protein
LVRSFTAIAERVEYAAGIFNGTSISGIAVSGDDKVRRTLVRHRSRRRHQRAQGLGFGWAAGP